MATAVMRCFAGYTLPVILDTPYCHFLKLYSMAEKAENLEAYTVLQGTAALHDKKLIDELGYVKDSKYVHPKIDFTKKHKG